MNLIEAKSIWGKAESKIRCKVSFPVVYLEFRFAREIRVFYDINHILGDVDFACYSQGENPIIIDSVGKIFHIGFELINIPIGIIDVINCNSLLRELVNALTESKDLSTITAIEKCSNFQEAIMLLVNKYCW
jgi:hypothetical protein